MMLLTSKAGYIAVPSGRQNGLSNGQLGMMLLIGTEVILFSCFISAYLVLRMASPVWPPSGTPPLQLGLSVLNTAVLTASAVLLWRRSMGFGAILGSLFVALQFVEFHRLYQLGLTLKTGSYGALFFTLIGCHGLHVLGGLIFIGAILWHPTPERIGNSQMYWYFVTAVWLILFAILYVL